MALGLCNLTWGAGSEAQRPDFNQRPDAKLNSEFLDSESGVGRNSGSTELSSGGKDFSRVKDSENAEGDGSTPVLAPSSVMSNAAGFTSEADRISTHELARKSLQELREILEFSG